MACHLVVSDVPPNLSRKICILATNLYSSVPADLGEHNQTCYLYKAIMAKPHMTKVWMPALHGDSPETLVPSNKGASKDKGAEKGLW